MEIQLVYHNGETWHVKAVLEEQQQQFCQIGSEITA